MSYKLWNTQTGQELLSVRAMQGQLSPDGKRVALSDYVTSRIKVYDTQNGQILLNVKEVNPGAAFSPDSKRLATQGDITQIWDLETGDEIDRIKGATNAYILAFSQDCKRFILVGQDKTQVWAADVDRQGAKKVLLPEVNTVYSADSSAVINSDLTRVAGISGKTVKLFDAQTGQELRTLTGHDQNLLCVAFSQNGQRVAASAGELNSNSAGTVKVWETETGKELFTIAGLAHQVTRIKFSPDGKKLAGSPVDGTIKVWDVPSGRERYGLGDSSASFSESSRPDYLFHTFAFSPDGKRLAWRRKIWDAETGVELVTLKTPPNTAGNFDTTAFSPDGKRVAGTILVSNPVVGGGFPRVTNGVWNAESGELLSTTSVASDGGCQTFSPDGKRLAGVDKMWDAETGQFLLSLGSGIPRGQVAFSPDGYRLAVIKAYGNELTIYDATPLPEKP
jgi:WD40 repeat protein